METAAANFFKKKIVTPVLTLLQQGVTPEKLALSIALGITLGVVPILGIITILCAFIAIRFRLNAPIMMVCCNLVYPVQVALFIPFVRFGEYTFDMPPLPISLDDMINVIKTDWMAAVNKFWIASLLGIFSWAIIAVPLSFCIYYCLLLIIRRSKVKSLAH